MSFQSETFKNNFNCPSCSALNLLLSFSLSYQLPSVKLLTLCVFEIGRVSSAPDNPSGLNNKKNTLFARLIGFEEAIIVIQPRAFPGRAFLIS
jgi:hypothetical protein